MVKVAVWLLNPFLLYIFMIIAFICTFGAMYIVSGEYTDKYMTRMVQILGGHNGVLAI